MPLLVTKDMIDRAIFRWEARHSQRMTYVELARRAEITLASLNRLMSGDIIAPDLRKLHAIGKVLECDPRELFEDWLTPDKKDVLQKTKSRDDADRIEDEFKARGIEQELEAEARQAFAKKFKGWILHKEYADRPDVVLLKLGASPVYPKPDEIQHLTGAFAEEWRRQNPKAQV